MPPLLLPSPPLLLLLLCGCRDRFGLAVARARTLAGTHALKLARSLSACDARRSVLPSKLVALATLSSDLNMVAPMLKQMCGVSAQFPPR